MESEQRKNAIRGAYHLTGSNNFYDGMITCSTFSGKAVCRMVWAMNRQECEEVDILLDSNGDLAFKGTDIVLANSVRQKIKIRLKWFFQEWRWDDEAGVPYFEYLFVKNPDIDQIKELIEEQIFNVDEITEVNDVSIEIDSLKRSAVIRYEAVTDEKTYKEEVKIGG